MPPSPIEAKAKRLHRAYERRMVERLKPSYSGRPWGELTGSEQEEFTKLATIIHSNLDMHARDLALLLCEHYQIEPGKDHVAYFVRRIREAKGPRND